MPTRKISDEREEFNKVCRHPDHDPPTMRVYEPGTYEHECPACKRVITFHVRGVYLELPKRQIDWAAVDKQMEVLIRQEKDRIQREKQVQEDRDLIKSLGCG